MFPVYPINMHLLSFSKQMQLVKLVNGLLGELFNEYEIFRGVRCKVSQNVEIKPHENGHKGATRGM